MMGGASLCRRLALAAIRAYQRYLSPYKGFSCALRAATGSDSCSAYGYRAIRLAGLATGLRLLDRRMALCGHIHRKYAAVKNPALYRQQGYCDLPCDVPHLSCDLPHLSCADEALQCCGESGCDLVDSWRGRRKRRAPAVARTAQLEALEQRVRARRRRN
jgi:putative component of membrane protein insertase Oxa1/YidC/SpoIIIJ protein YidD